MRSLWRLTNNFHDAKVLLSVTVSLNETGLAVYVKGAGLPFAQTISLENSVASNIFSPGFTSRVDTPFHYNAFGYTLLDWDCFYDHLRDVSWEDIFTLSAAMAIARFCE